MPTLVDPYPAQPNETGSPFQRRSDRYVVRWTEKRTLHARYFRLEADAETFLLYCRHYDANAYAAAVA